MTVVRFHCPFVGLSGCHDGGGNGLTKTSLITHLRDRHCNGEAQAITKHSLLTDLVIFERAEGSFVSPPDSGDSVVRFVLYDLTKSEVSPCSEQLNHVEDLLHDQHGGFTLAVLDSLYSKGLRTVISIPPKCHLGFSRVLKGALDKTFLLRNNLECKSANKRQRQEESIIDDDDLDLGDRNIKQCKRKICDGHYTAAVRVLSSSGVAPYNEATLEDLKTKHPLYPAPSLPHISTDHHHLIASSTVVLDRIKSFPRGTSCGRDGLCAQHLMDCLSGAAVAVSDELISFITQVVNLFLAGNYPQMLGEYIASAPLTPLIKPGSGIRPIAVCTIWRRLVSKVSTIMIGHSLDGYLDGLQFGAGVAGGSEAILYSVNRLIEASGADVGLSMLLVDFNNAFNLVDREVMFHEVCLRCPAISRWVEFCYYNPAKLYYGEHTLWSCQGVQQGDPLGPLLFFLVLHPLICKIRDSFSLSLHAWYLDDGTIIGDTVIVGKILELIMEDGPRCGLQLNVDKTKVFWPKEDPRSRLTGIFPPNISRPLHGVKLLGGPASVDFDFCNELVMKRVAKTIGLMDAIAKINDPQCELLLLRSCTGIPGYTLLCAHALLVSLSLLSFLLTWLFILLWGVFYGFLASRLQSTDLHTKLLRHTGIVSPGPIFDDALSVFYTSMKTGLLSNPSEIAAPKLMKKMADIYFTRVTKNAKSTFSLSPRQMALWTSQREDHTSDWLKTVPIFGLGQTMNGKTYRCVLCYRLGIPLFSGSKPCSACSRVFTGDIYGDHAVSCGGIIGIKHRHNVVRDTLVDICYRSGISAGKEVDIGLDGGRDKPLRPADILLYSWDGGLDVCLDLTGPSPLTQIGMIDFIPSRAVIVAAQRKRGKYMDMCAAIGYGFLPFSFLSLGQLEADAVTLLKRIRKFSITQDIGAHAAIHIFNRISFAIAKGVGAR
ncbi:reverse transcriptase domain-containing protein [Tanacetum coccineum]